MIGRIHLAAIAGLILLGGSGLGIGQTSDPAKRNKIIISTGIDASAADLVIAVKKGFMEKYNVQAEYKPFEDANFALDTVLTGSGDMGDSSETGGLVRRARGGNLYVVGVGPSAPRQIGIVVRGDISKPKDIEGKTVGFPRGSGAHLFFVKYVAHHKLDQSKIKVVTLPTPESVAAIRRGDIDVLFIWNPWLTRVTREVPNTKIFAFSGDDGVFVVRQFYYFGQRLIDDKDLGARVLKGLIDANNWVRDNPDEAAKILSGVYNLSVEDIKSQIQTFTWGTVRFTPEVRKATEEAAQTLLGIKLIDKIPNLDEYLRPEILKMAAPERVIGY